MKKYLFSLIALLSLGLAACTGNTGTDQQLPPAQPAEVPAVQPVAPDSNAAATAQAAPAAAAQALPEPVSAFLKQHFPNATVSYVKTDSEYGGLEYDLTLSDGTEIDFDTNNQWDNVDCHVNPVPASLIPASIAGYVKANYQSLPVTKIDREPHGFDIRLSNGLELRFAPNGNFLGIDD